MSSHTTPRRGRFIAFEGGDGSGKSTQAQRLAESLGARLTREPGGTPIGEKIRDLVLNPENSELGARTEALLMAASRAQHVSELIEPELASGNSVVTDRFIASSLVYQGAGRGLGIEPVEAVNLFATGGLLPDLVVLLDVAAGSARARLGDNLDRIEQAELSEVVAETYRELAKHSPQRWVVVGAEGSIDDVEKRVRAAVRERLDL